MTTTNDSTNRADFYARFAAACDRQAEAIWADPIIPAESPATDAEQPRYWKNVKGALLTSPIARNGWEEITEEQYHAIKRSMAEAAAYWAGSISAKGPRADITR